MLYAELFYATISTFSPTFCHSTIPTSHYICFNTVCLVHECGLTSDELLQIGFGATTLVRGDIVVISLHTTPTAVPASVLPSVYSC